MKNIKAILFCAFCAVLILTISNCSSDDDDDMEMEGELVDVEDPNAVADAVSIPGSTVVEGDPPAPSTDPSAPQIGGGENLLTSQGGNPTLELDLVSGDAAGIYLQISGADSYFDIPASAFTGGRILQEDSPAIEIELPEGIEPGQFCVDYCIYDAETRVSNIVTVCIDIAEFGGENSEFLTGAWDVISITETEDGESETIIVGQDSFEDDFTVNWGCADGTFQDLLVVETEFFEFITITFSDDGSLRFQSNWTETIFDGNNTTCQEVAYTTESGSDDANGAWSYDDGQDRLILVIDFEEDEGEDVIDMSIEVNGNTITGVQDFGGGETNTIVLQKK
ncbi:MAG: hypothetical protein AAF391_07075 [Bacteroidota bacterium]